MPTMCQGKPQFSVTRDKALSALEIQKNSQQRLLRKAKQGRKMYSGTRSGLFSGPSVMEFSRHLLK